MDQGFEHDVFPNHDRADKPRLRRMLDRLRAAELRVRFVELRKSSWHRETRETHESRKESDEGATHPPGEDPYRPNESFFGVLGMFRGLNYWNQVERIIQPRGTGRNLRS